jgi:hypothetical protein
MPERLLAPAAMATVLCLTIAAVPGRTSAQTQAQAPGAMSAEQGWSSVARCAQEDSERSRHTCLDRLLREAGLLTDEMHARQQRRAFGLDEKPARTPPPNQAAPASNPSAAAATTTAVAEEALNRRAAQKTPAGTTSPAATAPTAANTSAPSAQPDRLEVELAKVGKAANGRLFVTTTDGAVWLQAESVEMPQPPVAGDRMTIRKGSMGGYRCSVASTHLTYRCTRSR